MTNQKTEMTSGQRGDAQPYNVHTTSQCQVPMTWATFVHRRRQARLQRKLFQTMVTALSAG